MSKRTISLIQLLKHLVILSKNIIFLTRYNFDYKNLAKRLFFYFPNTIVVNDENQIEEFYNIKVFDYLLCLGYQKKIKKNFLDKIKIASINFHPGSTYNPGYGCYSYTLLNNQKFSGVTCHHMTEEFDEGSVIKEKRFSVYEKDNFTSLKDRTTKYMSELFDEILDIIISNKALPISASQWKSKPKTYKDFYNDFLKIELKTSEVEIKKKLLCLNPNYPGPHTKLIDPKII